MQWAFNRYHCRNTKVVVMCMLRQLSGHILNDKFKMKTERKGLEPVNNKEKNERRLSILVGLHRCKDKRAQVKRVELWNIEELRKERDKPKKT